MKQLERPGQVECFPWPLCENDKGFALYKLMMTIFWTLNGVISFLSYLSFHNHWECLYHDPFSKCDNLNLFLSDSYHGYQGYQGY